MQRLFSTQHPQATHFCPGSAAPGKHPFLAQNDKIVEFLICFEACFKESWNEKCGQLSGRGLW